MAADPPQKIEHAGFSRYIVARNPHRYDEDGDELDYSEADEEADEEAAGNNAYGEIHLEGEPTAQRV